MRLQVLQRLPQSLTLQLSLPQAFSGFIKRRWLLLRGEALQVQLLQELVVLEVQVAHFALQVVRVALDLLVRVVPLGQVTGLARFELLHFLSQVLVFPALQVQLMLEQCVLGLERVCVELEALVPVQLVGQRDALVLEGAVVCAQFIDFFSEHTLQLRVDTRSALLHLVGQLSIFTLQALALSLHLRELMAEFGHQLICICICFRLLVWRRFLRFFHCRQFLIRQGLFKALEFSSDQSVELADSALEILLELSLELVYGFQI